MGTSTVPHPVAQAYFVARTETKAMLLSVRAVFLVVVYGLISTGFARIGLWLDDRTEGAFQALPSKMAGLSPDQKQKMVEELGGLLRSEHLARAVLQGDLPPLALFVLLFSTFALPFLVLLVGFNRVGDDLHSGFTRYLLQRVHRGPYLAGKLVGHWVVSFLAVIVAHSLLLAYGALTKSFDPDAVISSLPRVWCGMAFFVLAYVAYTSIWSVAAPSSFLSLLLGGLALFLIWGVSWLPPFRELWIGQWDVRLFSLDPSAIAVFAGYTTGFIALAYSFLRWRDV